MATLTVSLPETMKDWIEAQVEEGTYASASDYLTDLVLRDREDKIRDHDERLAEIRRIVDEADASGISSRTTEEIFAEAEQIARARGIWRE